MKLTDELEAEALHHKDQSEKSLESFKDDFTDATGAYVAELVDRAWREGAGCALKVAGWRLIESAPTDCTYVDLWGKIFMVDEKTLGKVYITECRFTKCHRAHDVGPWCQWTPGSKYDVPLLHFEATHWMQIPGAP